MSSLCIRHCLKMCVSSFKFELTAKKKSWNLPSLIDQKLDLTDRKSQKLDSANF